MKLGNWGYNRYTYNGYTGPFCRGNPLFFRTLAASSLGLKTTCAVQRTHPNWLGGFLRGLDW